MSIPSDIINELRQQVDSTYKKGVDNFFTEPAKDRRLLGVRVPNVRKISATYYRIHVATLSKEETFAVCEQLLKKNYMETHIIAFDWAFRKKKEYKASDFKTFEQWLKKYVTNWATCDDFCTHALGYLLCTYPELIKKTIPWRTSKNRWLRRASAVALIYSTRRHTIKQEVFDVATALLSDTDDLVQKGYGWLLKETAHRSYPSQVQTFLEQHVNVMPRTAFRYAIEKYPEETRKYLLSL